MSDVFEFAEITKDMTAAEILNYYRNLYYAEPQVTERGIVANAINDYFKEVVPRADVAREIFAEIESTISSMEYNANTPRKTVKVEELKAQVDWILHEVIPQTLAELKKKHVEGDNE